MSLKRVSSLFVWTSLLFLSSTSVFATDLEVYRLIYHCGKIIRTDFVRATFFKNARERYPFYKDSVKYGVMSQDYQTKVLLNAEGLKKLFSQFQSSDSSKMDRRYVSEYLDVQPRAYWKKPKNEIIFQRDQQLAEENIKLGNYLCEWNTIVEITDDGFLDVSSLDRGLAWLADPTAQLSEKFSDALKQNIALSIPQHFVDESFESSPTPENENTYKLDKKSFYGEKESFDE